MWFTKGKEQDKRPPTQAAKAIAESLTTEPRRWQKHGDKYLRHDSGVIVGADGFVWSPELEDEPGANGELVAAAIDAWVAAMMREPPPNEEEGSGETQQDSSS